MKAAVFTGVGTFEIQERPIPEIGPEDALVKVAACGVCGTDVHIYHGDPASAPVKPPVVLGHEFSGIVEKIGSRVTRIHPGDPVTVDPNIYCGQCEYCRAGRKQLCENLFAIGVNRDGGFAEYCTVPESQCFQLDRGTDLLYGAMTEPLACCIHGMDRLPLRSGETVCIIGGGAIGLMMLQLARLKGAATIIVSEPAAGRRAVAEQLGADFTINPIEEKVGEKVRDLTRSRGADIVIECAGNPTAVRQSLEAAGPGASVLLFSVPMPGSELGLSLEAVYQKELTILGSRINPDTHSRAAALINRGLIRLDPIITHRYPIEKMDEAVRMQMSQESLKVVVGNEICR